MKKRVTRLLQTTLVLSVMMTPLTALANPGAELTPGEHRQLKKLTNLSGGTIQVRWDEKRGTPSLLSGKLSNPLTGAPQEKALNFLNTVKDLYHFNKASQSFQVKKVDVDQKGMTHVRLSHVAKGIPVWGDELIVHIDKNNIVRSVNGEFTANVEKNTDRIGEAKIDSKQAIQAALQDVKVQKPDQPPTAALFYFPYPEPDQVTLTYVVTVHDRSQPAEWKVFVDAVNGDVVHKYNNLKFNTSTKQEQQPAPSPGQ